VIAQAEAPAAEIDEDSAAAWGTAGASLVPLLWSVPGEEEQEVLAPGYAEAEAGTWGESPITPAAPAEEEEPRFATWRPNRSISTGSSEQSAMVFRSGADVSCADGDYEPEAVEEEPEPEPEAEEAPSRGAADLLVQASDTWGVAADDDFGAII
jgi:hypothetical protein